eukprot:2965642-Alexandrium_andersonii.AAC.1
MEDGFRITLCFRHLRFEGSKPECVGSAPSEDLVWRPCQRFRVIYAGLIAFRLQFAFLYGF